jgi:hypothetical protein
MSLSIARPLSQRLRVFVFVLAFGSGAAAASASAPDPELLIALDGIWQLERPAVSTLAEGLDRKDGSDPVRFESEARDALAYLHTSAEDAAVEFARKRFPAQTSSWGALPRLQMSDARLIEVTLPRKRYLVLSGVGEGLFRIGDWQRFGFLHVVDVSQRWAPVHYPLVAEAGLRERVIGRLPGSPVLNYLRLVPAHWSDPSTIDAYEVLVYALNPKGAERVKQADGSPLAYRLARGAADQRWQLQPITATPVADARDAAGASFSAPPAAAERGWAQTAPAAEPIVGVAAGGAPAIVGTSAAVPAAPHAANSSDAAPEPAKSDKFEQLAGNEAQAQVDSAEAAAKSKAQDAATESASSAFKKKLPSLH